MKKFLITFFFLLAISGTVFFFGWAQFKVPPGSYGVINSKTHGVDPQMLRSGEFRWVWYKLIPTNVQIAVFQIESVKFPVNFNSSLPSGDSYASFAGLSSVDFSWSLRGEISFSIDPESLVALVTENNLTDQQALDNHIRHIVQSIESIIMRTFASWETDSQRLERALSGNPDRAMEQEINNRFTEIRDFSFTIQSARFPDFILYRQVRLLYEEFLARQREFVSSAFGIRAENHIEAQLRFGELERYGELLTRYPVLLEYLAMNTGREGQ